LSEPDPGGAPKRLDERRPATDLFVGSYVSAPVGLGVVDAELRYVFVNDLLAQVNGVPAEAHVGRTVEEVLPGFGEVIEPLLRGVLDSGEPLLDISFSSERPDEPGKLSHWRACYYPIRGQGGATQGVGIMVEDVTPRAEAELALRASEQRTRQILEGALDAVIEIDQTGVVRGWSANAEAMFGRTREEIVGTSLAQLLIPERYRKAHRRGLEHFLQTGDGPILGRRVDLTALRRNGEEFPVELTVTATHTDEGWSFTAFVRDIEDRVRARQELIRTMERLSALHEIDQVILSAGSVQEMADRALQRLLDAIPRASRLDITRAHAANTEQEVLAAVGGPAITARPGDRVVVPHDHELEGLRHGKPIRIPDLQGIHPRSTTLQRMADRGVRDVALLPIMIGSEFLGTLAMLGDAPDAFDHHAVTMAGEVADQLAIGIHHAELRAELRRHAAELESRVAARTQDLADRNEELDAFAYSVSHDLRAPLRSMQGFATALREDYAADLDATGLDYARRVADAALNMDELIRDLLAYSRLSRADLRLSPTSVREALDLAIAHNAADAQERGAVLTVGGDLPRVVAHHGTLVQVFSNLIGNAIKFVRPGASPRIGVTSRVEGEVTRITVRDNGIGIAPDHHERIFRVLERLHSQDAYPGTGIGLAIVRKGLERMGGSICVQSEEGVGSTFVLELPTAPAGAS
jgi:PAS domain S-box-containing protein